MDKKPRIGDDIKIQSVFKENDILPPNLRHLIKTDLESYVASLSVDDILMKDPNLWS